MTIRRSLKLKVKNRFRTKNNIRVWALNSGSIVVLGLMYILGVYVTTGEWDINTNIMGLIIITIIILLTLLIPYITKSISGAKHNNFVFVVSLLMLIIAFAVAYSLIWNIDETFTQVSFSYSGTEYTDFSYFDYIYYSVVTFTTLGYGDMLPITLLARTYTMIETLIFVIYISIIVLNNSTSKN